MNKTNAMNYVGRLIGQTLVAGRGISPAEWGAVYRLPGGETRVVKGHIGAPLSGYVVAPVAVRIARLARGGAATSIRRAEAEDVLAEYGSTRNAHPAPDGRPGRRARKVPLKWALFVPGEAEGSERVVALRKHPTYGTLEAWQPSFPREAAMSLEDAVAVFSR